MFRRSLKLLGLGLLAPSLAQAGPPPHLVGPEARDIREAKTLIQRMQDNPRGPYSRLRWWCKDGSILPPAPYACVPHGGGRQHGEYSDDRRRLESLGLPVGTVLAALPEAEFQDPRGRFLRLQQLILERFLVETQDGWVMRKARFYRGHVQAEDEEAAATRLLAGLFANPAWIRDHFLLGRELARSLPHGTGGDRTREVRRWAQTLAEKVPAFESLRIQIHSTPSAKDLLGVRSFLARPPRPLSTEELALANSLLSGLEALYGPNRDALGSLSKLLPSREATRVLAQGLASLPSDVPGLGRIARLASLLQETRVLLETQRDGALALRLFDLSLELERELSRAGREFLQARRSIRDLWNLARWLGVGIYGAGLLSPGELQEILRGLDLLPGRQSLSLEEAERCLRGLRRVPGWALGTARHRFAEVLARWTPIEPEVPRYLEDLLRGSPLLVLGDLLGFLTQDLDRRLGRGHHILGQTFGGAFGLNPGVARGPLRILEPEAARRAPREALVLLPRTVSELAPVAGILSQAEGSLLSHVQILARNLGIPNVSISAELGRRLKDQVGKDLVLVVSSKGSVWIDAATKLPPELVERYFPTKSQDASAPRLRAPSPDLGVRNPLPLSELSARLSGKVVGPKAANLGELARRFPGRVGSALALPFGFFESYASEGSPSLRERLVRVYAQDLSEEVRAGQLEALRREMAGWKIRESDRRLLRELFVRHFGSADLGVFIRSDTNVEDLPGFTGAGLNETLANIVGFDKVLEAIPRVWSSMLSPRSLAWRSRLLLNPAEVFSSVLLMPSIPVEKSGVLVTFDLVEDRPGVTVSTAFGPGGAVDGEDAETWVLRPNGTQELVFEAAAPYRRVLPSTGGVEYAPAPRGPVLTRAEITALRDLAREVTLNRPPAGGGADSPWDIEFGFHQGSLVLFQIRPLVQRGHARADALFRELASSSSSSSSRALPLEATLDLETLLPEDPSSESEKDRR